MNTKFDQIMSEAINKSEGFTSTDIIRRIRQDLTQSSSRLDNLAGRWESTSREAQRIRQAMLKIDEARTILWDLQD